MIYFFTHKIAKDGISYNNILKLKFMFILQRFKKKNQKSEGNSNTIESDESDDINNSAIYSDNSDFDM